MTAKERKTPTAGERQGHNQKWDSRQGQSATNRPASQAPHSFGDLPSVRKPAPSSPAKATPQAREQAAPPMTREERNRATLDALKANAAELDARDEQARAERHAAAPGRKERPTAALQAEALMRRSAELDAKQEPAPQEEEAPPQQNAPPQFTPLTCEDVLNLPPVEWAVEDLIVAQGIGQIFGQSGAGKTFLALDLAHALITGGEWYGHRITKPRPVVYIGLEGRAGLRKRIQAITQVKNHGKPYHSGDLTVFLPDHFDITDSDHVAAIAAACPKGAVVFIDTQNQAAAHLNENASEDMGRLIRNTQTLARLVDGCAILIAHAGKDASKGVRGHSSQMGAMDFQIEVTRAQGSKVRQWTAYKVKDGEDGEKHAFELDRVQVGVKEDGRPIFSCVVVETEAQTFDPAEARKGKRQPPKWPIHVLDLLMELTGGHKGPENAVTTDRLKAAFFGSERVNESLQSQASRETTFYAALRTLKKNGHLDTNKRNCWITTPE